MQDSCQKKSSEADVCLKVFQINLEWGMSIEQFSATCHVFLICDWVPRSICIILCNHLPTRICCYCMQEKQNMIKVNAAHGTITILSRGPAC